MTSRQNAIKDHTIEWLEKHFPGLFQEIQFGNHFALDGISRPKSEICRMRGRGGGYLGGSARKDTMYHSLAGKDQISPRQLLWFKGSSEDQALIKKYRKSQVEKVPRVQFYSQGADDVPATKHKKRRKQVDLRPTSSLPGEEEEVEEYM